jgi:hypothetical protein
VQPVSRHQRKFAAYHPATDFVDAGQDASPHGRGQFVLLAEQTRMFAPFIK